MPVSALRFYESSGLLKSQRSPANYREFPDDAGEQVRQIQNLRALDLSLSEIKLMLEWTQDPRQNCSEVCSFIEARLVQVRQRLASLQELEGELQRLLALCSGEGPCQILAALACTQSDPKLDCPNARQ